MRTEAADCALSSTLSACVEQELGCGQRQFSTGTGENTPAVRQVRPPHSNGRCATAWPGAVVPPKGQKNGPGAEPPVPQAPRPARRNASRAAAGACAVKATPYGGLEDSPA